MRGADLVVKTLAEAGVDTIFTLSGNQIMPVFDACIDYGIKLVHVRHEGAAVYMADAYAQVTGKVGVAVVTAAPGFVNAMSALISTRANESPVLVLSGDAPLSQDGMGGFQEMDQVATSTPLSKASLRTLKAAEFGADVAGAIRIALGGRPGPVHIAMPFDLLCEEVADADTAPTGGFEPESQALAAGDVAAIHEALAASKRPLILTGPALMATRSGDLIERLGAGLAAPVIEMESPRGLRDPALGDLASALGQADAVLVLGKEIDFMAGFGGVPPFSPDCRFLVVDPTEDALVRAAKLLGNRAAGLFQADPMGAGEALIAAAPNTSRDEWCQMVNAKIAARNFDRTAPTAPDRVLPVVVCDAVQKVLDDASETILVCDGGEFGQWSQAALKGDKRVINGPLGAIGGGTSYAVAAKLARPSATVVVMMGDGTAGFYFAEFETAIRTGANIIAVIGNDAQWNAEVQIQLRDFGPDRQIGCDLNPTRYDLAVVGFGGHGEYVTDPADLAGALSRAIASGKTACINVDIEGLGAPSGASH
jgi:acetolactate synthase-1/2/3 large subunit